MLNISILWEDSNLGNTLQVALENEGSITPTVGDAVHGCHHGCIEYLHNAILVAIPVCWRINGIPVGVVDLYLTGSTCLLIEEHLRTYLDTQLDEVCLHDAETTGVIPCEAVWILDGAVVYIGSECCDILFGRNHLELRTFNLVAIKIFHYNLVGANFGIGRNLAYNLCIGARGVAVYLVRTDIKVLDVLEVLTSDGDG